MRAHPEFQGEERADHSKKKNWKGWFFGGGGVGGWWGGGGGGGGGVWVVGFVVCFGGVVAFPFEKIGLSREKGPTKPTAQKSAQESRKKEKKRDFMLWQVGVTWE